MLTKRLTKIISFLPACQTLADVGCDHGYVGLEALKSGVAHDVVFIDISQPSLQKALQNCQQALKTHASFLCQDGLQHVKADCAVIAGMGGLEIISVLSGAEVLPQWLVLQPMRDQATVRQWLTSRYKIVRDEKFFDGKFYDLILAQASSTPTKLTDDELLFGQDNLNNPTPDFVAYLQKLKTEYNQILTQCNDAGIAHKLQTVCRVLAQITEEQQ